MPTIIGIWIALPGVLAVLAGLTGIGRVRRLRRSGVKAWAMAVPESLAMPEFAAVPESAVGPERAAAGDRRMALQYTLPDGLVLERHAPATRKSGALRPGQQVLIWYDPADPLDILVYGREGRLSNLMFVLVGAAFVLLGAAIAVFAP